MNAVPTAALATSLFFPSTYGLLRPLVVFACRVALLTSPTSHLIIKSAILGRTMASRGPASVGATPEVCDCPVGFLMLLFFATRAMGVFLMAFDNDLDVVPAAAAQMVLAVLSRQADGSLCSSPMVESPVILSFLRTIHYILYGALAPEEIESPGASLLALCYTIKTVLLVLPVVVAARRQAAREAANDSSNISATAAIISETASALQARPLHGALLGLLALQLLWALCYGAAKRTCA